MGMNTKPPFPVPIVEVADYEFSGVLTVNVSVLEECAFSPTNPLRWSGRDVEAALGLGVAYVQAVAVDRRRA